MACRCGFVPRALARRIVTGVVIAFAGALTSPAIAAEGDVAASDFFPIFGPRLSGDTVLWTVPRRDQGYVMKRGRPSSRDARSIFTAKSQRNRRVALTWVASPQETLVQQALVDTTGDDLAGGLAIDLGTSRLLPSGRLEGLAPGEFPNIGNFDLDGNVGVFPGKESGSAVVRDFSQPSSPPVQIENAGFGLATAGRYAAWSVEEDIVVYDYTTMTELYRVTPPTPASPRLQADGKVAFLVRVPAGRTSQLKLGWASPSEPFLHELPVAPSSSYDFKLRNDAVVFERNGGTLSQTVQGDLGYVSLTGGEETILARSVETAGGTDDLFDFDGEQVAWLDRTCFGARVRVAAVDELIARPRGSRGSRCRLRLIARPSLTRQGELRLRVSCRGFRRDCNVFGATLRLARPYDVGGRRLSRGTRLFAERRQVGLSSVARFRISRQTRRLLRQPGPVRLALTVRMGDPDLTERRRTTVTVR